MKKVGFIISVSDKTITSFPPIGYNKSLWNMFYNPLRLSSLLFRWFVICSNCFVAWKQDKKLLYESNIFLSKQLFSSWQKLYLRMLFYQEVQHRLGKQFMSFIWKRKPF